MLSSTIYVSIASLYDPELIPTIHDAFSKAKNPARLFLGVSIIDSNPKLYKEVLKETKKYGDNISIIFTKLKSKKEHEVLGVGRGRKLAHSMYADQDYFLQIDSHTMFLQNWDEVLISLHKESVIYFTKNPKTILTGYAGMYFVDEKQSRHLDPIANGDMPAGFLYPVFTRLEKNGPVPMWSMTALDKVSDTEERFIPCTKFNANFAFGNRYFAKYPGIPESAVFFEEEIFQSVSLLSMGFSLAFPNVGDALVKHLYVGQTMTDKGPVLNFGGRKAANDYLTDEQRSMQHKRVYDNYEEFLSDESLQKYISAYEKYTNVSMRNGRVSVETKLPTAWTIDEEPVAIERVAGDCD